jgi:hypothetical protein
MTNKRCRINQMNKVLNEIQTKAYKNNNKSNITERY